MSRRWFVLPMAALASLAVAGSVVAGSPHTVDPSTQSPALNPGFAPWTCTRTGSGSVCRGSETFDWADADLGLACDGRAILTTGAATIDAVRHGQSDGLATQTAFHSEVSEVWSLSTGGAGPTLRVRAQFNERFDYPVPGDVASRVYLLTGGYYQVTSPGRGLVWHDAGSTRVLPGPSGPVEVLHGPHDSENGILELILPDACAVLLGR